jgi:predicted transcriptional regulator
VHKNHVFLSIHPAYANAIANGFKTIELRKTNLNVQAGQRLWIYSTTPNCQVIATAIISDAVRASPNEIWRRFKADMGLQKKAFSDYCNQRSLMTAIVLSKVQRLARPVALKKLRASASTFHPPQLALYLDELHPIRRMLMAAKRPS